MANKQKNPNIIQANKGELAAVENYGNQTGDYAQIEQIILDDLERYGFPKDLSVAQVKQDPELYDMVVNAYWQRLQDFGIPEDQRSLWWLMPGRYKATGGDINKLENPEFRNIMANRSKWLALYRSKLNNGIIQK